MNSIEVIFNLYNKGYYTITTTFINVIIAFAIISFFLYLIRENKLVFDNNLWKGGFAWALFGVIIRIYADAYTISMPLKLFFITPFIYVETFSLALISYFFLNKKQWVSLPLFFTIVAFIPLFSVFSHFYLFLGLVLMATVALSYALAIYIFHDSLISLSFAMQMFDAVSTFIGITFRDYYEEHVLGREIINFLENHNLTFYGSGAWGFMLTKTVFVLLLLYFIKKYYENDKYYYPILFFISLIGFVVGLRNAINLIFL